MKLWLLVNKKVTGYDTYDSAVVAANTIEEARYIHPQDYKNNWWEKDQTDKWWERDQTYASWCLPADVEISFIGEADEKILEGVICASFNAG